MSRFCTSCGTENIETAQFCKKCGNELSSDSFKSREKQQQEQVIVSKTSGKAIASLVFSLLWIYGLGSILGIIFGHMARTDIKNSNGKLTGDGLALAGLIIGYLLFIVVTLGILAAVAIPKFAAVQ